MVYPEISMGPPRFTNSINSSSCGSLVPSPLASPTIPEGGSYNTSLIINRGWGQPLYSGKPASFGQSSSLSFIPSPSESVSSSRIDMVISRTKTMGCAC